MAALTLSDVKAYLRIQHDAEDVVLNALLARATALVESYLGRPIYTRQETRTVYVEGDQMRGGAKVLFVPFYPLQAVQSVTAQDGTVVPLEDLFVDLRSGTVAYKSGQRFSCPAYTFVVSGGLEAFPEFDVVIEPAVQSAIMDTVADLYQRRNPASAAEREGGGVAVEYGSNTRSGVADNFREDQLIPRVAYTIAPWRMLGVVA